MTSLPISATCPAVQLEGLTRTVRETLVGLALVELHVGHPLTERRAWTVQMFRNGQYAGVCERADTLDQARRQYEARVAQLAQMGG